MCMQVHTCEELCEKKFCDDKNALTQYASNMYNWDDLSNEERNKFNLKTT